MQNLKIKRMSRHKTTPIIATLLMLAIMLPIVLASTPNVLALNTVFSIPGVTNPTIIQNKTDITPNAEREQVKAGELSLYCYRNMTMLMNCTRNCEFNFTMDPSITPKIFCFNIDPEQTMALTMNMNSSPLNGEQVMTRTLNFYLGIEPNATLQLQAQIRLYINQAQLVQELGRTVNISQLTWMFYNTSQNAWQVVPSYIDADGYLVCNTNHFSTWTVAEVGPKVVDKSDVTPNLEREQVMAGELATFNYRNMTMMMNCSQNCDVLFTMDPQITPKQLGLNIEANQNMQLTMTMTKSPLTGVQEMQRTLNFYLGIEPNATLQLQAQLRLRINESQLSQEFGRTVDVSKLTWMFYNTSANAWQAVPSYIDAEGYLVCNTNHFSTWTIAEVDSKIDYTVYYLAAMAVAIVIAIAVFVLVKRR